MAAPLAETHERACRRKHDKITVIFQFAEKLIIKSDQLNEKRTTYYFLLSVDRVSLRRPDKQRAGSRSGKGVSGQAWYNNDFRRATCIQSQEKSGDIGRRGLLHIQCGQRQRLRHCVGRRPHRTDIRIYGQRSVRSCHSS